MLNFPKLTIGINQPSDDSFQDDLFSEYFDFKFVTEITDPTFSELSGYLFFPSLENGSRDELENIVPFLPIEDVSALADASTRTSFFTRIYRYSDWQVLKANGIAARDLVNFQAEQKYLLMAYDQHRAKALGRMVAESGNSGNLAELAEEFITLTMQVLSSSPSRKQHSNALHHIMGYLRKQIDCEQKKALLECILSFEKGESSILAPIALLERHFQTYPNAYIAKQKYLSPFPAALRID